MVKSKTKTNTNAPVDILDQESPLAFLGSYSARLENDPEFGKKVYSGLFLGLSLISLIISFVVPPEVKPGFLGFTLLLFLISLFFFFFYAPLKRYDIASSRRYCETLHPNGSPKVIRTCLIERQREERLRQSFNNNNINFLTSIQ